MALLQIKGKDHPKMWQENSLTKHLALSESDLPKLLNELAAKTEPLMKVLARPEQTCVCGHQKIFHAWFDENDKVIFDACCNCSCAQYTCLHGSIDSKGNCDWCGAQIGAEQAQARESE